jgi:transcriptional regulator with XRE-family HTH domain
MEPMTTDELRKITERLGWTQSDLATNAKRDYSRIRKMARGAEPIDAELASWLRRIWDLEVELDKLIDDGVPIKRP